MPPEKVQEFAKKFAALTALSFLVYPENTDFVSAAQNGQLKKSNISGYEDIETQEAAALKKYFEMFHFSYNAQGQIIDGWLRQLHRSASGQGNFLFNAELFGLTNSKEVKKFEFNKKLFRPDEEDINNYSFKTSFFGSPFDSFKDEFVKQKDNDSIQYKIEKLIKRMYDTINSLYGF